jgi:hypothetical protein
MFKYNIFKYFFYYVKNLINSDEVYLFIKNNGNLKNKSLSKSKTLYKLRK